MKLLKAHINNFGMLNDADFSFDTNPFTLFKDNGEGKTTLLNFILAMLFGLDTDRARNKEETLRAIYYPYNGGLFGGSLELNANNKIYRIERTFDKKSTAKDELIIYINNKKSDVDIVKDIIHLDEESFLKTLYFKNMDYDLSTPDSLTNQILNLESASNIASNYSDAYNSIKKLENNYTKNSSNGIIKGLENTILDANKRKLSLSYDEEDLIKLKNDKEEKENTLASLENEKENISSLEGYLTKEELKTTIQNKITIYEDKNKEILSRYGGEIISISEIAELRRLYNSYLKEKDTILNARFTDPEEYEFLDLDYLFKIHPLKDEDILLIKEKEKRLEILKEKLNTPKSEISDEEKEIFDLFTSKELKEEDIASLDQDIEEYNTLLNKVTVSHEIKGNNKKNYFAIILFIVTTLFLIAGILFIVFSLTIYSYIFFGLSALSLITGVIILFKNKGDNPSNNVYQDTLRMREIEEKVHTLCTKYGIYSSSIVIDASTLKNKYQNYLSFKDRFEQEIKERNDHEKEIREIAEYLDNIRTQYHIKEDNLSSALENKYRRYISLKERCDSFHSIIQEANKNLANVIEQFEVINKKYHLNLALGDEDYIEKVDSYHNDVVNYENNNKYIIDNKKELNELIRETTTIDISSLRSKDEVIEDIKNIKEELDNIIHQIKEYENAKKEIDELDRLIYQSEEKLKDAKEVARLYQLTLDMLEDTNNTIISKYIDPIKNRFSKYASMIHDTLGKEVRLSSSFVLEFKQGDTYHSAAHLSLGEKTIASMVLRIAFIEELYKEEKPFILLDDPFVDLDDNHLKKAIKLINNIAQDMQVIYITCHSSRKLA